MPTFGQLLKNVEDVAGDESTPVHQVLTVEPALQQSIPFVLSFREACDGELLAVLGASGSGKSTLIDALANRIAKESLKGAIKLNGEQLHSKLLKVISAYVMQDDLLYPMLTVEETLMLQARFRLPRTLSKSKKKGRVQALIDQLGLRNAAKTIIGDEEGRRGVSGGERRRVSIGIDIIHDPIILFLDEPASGQFHQCFHVVRRRIAPIFADFGHPIPEREQNSSLLILSVNSKAHLMEQKAVDFNKTRQNTKSSTNRNSETTPAKYDLSLKEAISASISRGKLVPGATTDAMQSYCYGSCFCKSNMDRNGRAVKSNIQKLMAYAGDFLRYRFRGSNGHRFHPRHHVLAT
ncbi:hypothetical protein HAX54_051303 [Datura stramonium]|uniref:ABC transporter domain-containing protein n=1 Tax=Datura stramonium TaxID=4076 RepID=A0ABS8SZ50_DATST|nr:hypothetical protein [Datura stramonium]